METVAALKALGVILVAVVAWLAVAAAALELLVRATARGRERLPADDGPSEDPYREAAYGVAPVAIRAPSRHRQ